MKKAVFTAVVACLTFGSLTASTSDTKYYPGNACHSDVPNSLDYNFTRAWNKTSQGFFVDCPITKDKPDNSVDFSAVYVVDQHPSASVQCTFWCIRSSFSGYEGWHSATMNSSGNSPAPQLLQLGSFYCTGDNSLTLACYLPPTSGGNQSGVVSYIVSEEGSSD